MLKLCRVCNTEFNACNGYSTSIPGMENWRTFCCSITCAQEYYNKIMISRNKDLQESSKEITEEIIADDIAEVEEIQSMQTEPVQEIPIEDYQSEYTSRRKNNIKTK